MTAPRVDGVVRVGNGQGFWGDSARGPVQLVEGGPLDYLTLDYLAEVTMSILQKARARDPRLGYATDFVTTVEQVLPRCRERGVRIVANAGGVNPAACADAVAEVAARLGAHGLRIGVVEGDDLLDRVGALVSEADPWVNLDTGEALIGSVDRVSSANAYLGAVPIMEALAAGADIVITGRCADASLAVGPIAHELGWDLADPGGLDRLAQATAGGHVIECGTQCTGGNFEDWRQVGGWTDLGYPILEASADGTMVVTKHPGTGGIVTPDTVTAQLLYEIGDPAAYVTPDVVADFSGITLERVGDDRVRIRGARGRPATDTYKVSVTLPAGFRVVGQLVVAGPDAVDRAELAAEILFARLAAEGIHFAPRDRVVEILGAGGRAPRTGATVESARRPAAPDPPEVVLRIAVRGDDRRALARFGAELAPLLLSGPPGLTGFAGGRPKPTEVLTHWPTLVPKAAVPTRVTIREVT